MRLNISFLGTCLFHVPDAGGVEALIPECGEKDDYPGDMDKARRHLSYFAVPDEHVKKAGWMKKIKVKRHRVAGGAAWPPHGGFRTERTGRTTAVSVGYRSDAWSRVEGQARHSGRQAWTALAAKARREPPSVRRSACRRGD